VEVVRIFGNEAEVEFTNATREAALIMNGAILRELPG